MTYLRKEHIDYLISMCVNNDKKQHRKVIQSLAKDMIERFNGLQDRRDFVDRLCKEDKYIDGAE